MGTVLLRQESGGCNVAVSIEKDGCRWEFGQEGVLVTKDGREIPFSAAGKVSHDRWGTGVGAGFRSRYSGFAGLGGFAFETILWAEAATGDIYAEWIPLEEDGAGEKLSSVRWPGWLRFDEGNEDWYSLLNLQQGLLLPNTWPEALVKLPFNGQFCSCAAYMPWFGQVRGQQGYIAICETPWDAGYICDHPENGPYTHLSAYWLPSLGKMDGRRVVRYTLLSRCDYNDLCKVYRQYAKETGLLTTLHEKAARNPKVDRLIGAGFIHTGIKTHVAADSEFFDPEAPEKNNRVTPFSARSELVQAYQARGVDKLYLHLDGWGDPGYDNQHPDYLPACVEAGGWDGMRELQERLQENGYLFGIHDQYRDYYFAAPTFDRHFGIQASDGSIFEMARWAGGHQTYLCATQAPFYVKRNFTGLFDAGIWPDCAYLDVFTCNEPDECCNPEHKMSRKDCLEFRSRCFAYLTSRGILPSSEEVTDWSMRELVFCHYAPYEFMMSPPGAPRKGIPVPLFNLVYHDCLIIPWPMERFDGQEDYMLYALLNGGAAYLQKDPAYVGIDGAFAGAPADIDENVSRWQAVSQLQRRVAKMEMRSHRFMGSAQHQETVFSDGEETVTVRVYLDSGRWEIEEGTEDEETGAES